jgi:hypothetical protein
MRIAAFTLLVACGGSEGGDDLRVTTSFAVTTVTGSGMSSLDALAGQTLDLEVIWDSVETVRGGTEDSAGCHSLYLGFFPRLRTAHGATADLVQREIMDKLDNWQVKLQLCDGGGSTVGVIATIDPLNLGLGCLDVPSTAQRRDSDGYPRLTSFTATRCSATILDVVNNRVLSNPSFSIKFETGPSQLP